MLNAEFFATDFFHSGEVHFRNITGQGENLFVDSIEDPAGLREIEFFQFGAGRDAVRCADDCGRCIEVVETEVGDVAGEVVEVRTAFASVRNEDDTSGFLDGFDNFFVVEGTLKQFKGDRSDPVEMGESSMAVRLAGGGSACFAFTGGGEYDTLVVKSSDIKVICLWNDEEYTPDGSGVVTVPLGDNGSQQYVFEMTNTSSSVREIAFELK